MPTSSLRSRLAAGERAYGTFVMEFLSAGLPQIARNAGADFLMYDFEHGALGFESLRMQVAACRGIGVTPLVRVPVGEYSYIARALDAGAGGVHVPMVETAEAAARIVACTRYPPAGIRGSCFGIAHDDYRSGDARQKADAANDTVLVSCTIETPRAIENVDAIAATPGVDVLWIGQGDLTLFMGIPGAYDSARYKDAVRRVIEACQRHGKTPGFLCFDQNWNQRTVELGFRLLAFSADIFLLQAALSAGITDLKRRTGEI
jgi:2-keto-3-deoxy-L-rhamnonate aldolase RhmA